MLVDRYLTTSDSDIFALGDCAEINGLVLPFVMPITHATRALAKGLAGKPTAKGCPPMPVIVKTPCMPILAAPPARDSVGEWRITRLNNGTVPQYEDRDGQLLGFALSGSGVGEKQAVTAKLPPLLD